MQRVVLSVALGAGTCASAQEVLQIDTNALTSRASGLFSEDFTGSLAVFNTPGDPDLDGDAHILDVLIDGLAQGTAGADTPDFSFFLEIEFSLGAIVSGGVEVSHDASGSENTYRADLLRSVGGAILEVGDGTFIIGGLTFEGLWSDPSGTFLAVDISPWGSNQPLEGSFSNIAFTPNDDHTDVDTDVDIFMVVPAPAGSLLLLGSLGVLGHRRR